MVGMSSRWLIASPNLDGMHSSTMEKHPAASNAWAVRKMLRALCAVAPCTRNPLVSPNRCGCNPMWPMTSMPSVVKRSINGTSSIDPSIFIADACVSFTTCMTWRTDSSSDMPYEPNGISTITRGARGQRASYCSSGACIEARTVLA